jgi:predicted AlkP superfamily phosphohydrolase/phosphomutase/tetratricopeptide (TPR) repeat protein
MGPPLANRVLLVGWDAADWKVIHPLLDAGELPNLSRIVDGGVIGNLATLYPVLSPMLWTSIATGKRAYKHGILGFAEPDPQSGRIRPVTNLSRKTKALWNILHQAGKRCNVVGWWPSHPAEPIRSVMVSNCFQRATGGPDEPWPMVPGTVHPPELEDTLSRLRIHPWELPGDALVPFVPRAAQIDQSQERRLVGLARTLAETASVHAAATAIMQLEPWDFMAVYYDAIDHFCHGFMRYHPPRQAWIPEHDYELYKDVVAGAYRFCDMMLGTLLRLAGDETTVILVSDHGFHSDHLRPQHLPNEPAGPAAEHRPLGIFAMKGPGVRTDARVYGASLLDVAPTVLTLFGLPVGRDMDGAPLSGAFESPPPIQHVDSWDDVAGDAGMHPKECRCEPLEERLALDQLVALGYLEEPDEDQQKAVADSQRELRYNLARALMGGDRHAEAAAILAECWQKWPEQHRFGVKLLDCQLAMRQVSDARNTFDAIVAAKSRYAVEAEAELNSLAAELKDRDADAWTPRERRRLHNLRRRAGTNHSALAFLEASLLRAEGRPREALLKLQQPDAFQAYHRPSVLRTEGEIHLELGAWDEADRCFRAAIELDPDDARAYLGLCRSLLPRRLNRRAGEAAAASIGLYFQNPRAHYLLGVARQRCGRPRLAAESFQTAISQNPNFAQAHQRLAFLYARRLGDPDRALTHRRLAAEAQSANRLTEVAQESGLNVY